MGKPSPGNIGCNSGSSPVVSNGIPDHPFPSLTPGRMPFANSMPASSSARWIAAIFWSVGLCLPDSNLRIVSSLTAALEANLGSDHPSNLRAVLTWSPVIIRAPW
jgi:hypothetical protein